MKFVFAAVLALAGCGGAGSPESCTPVLCAVSNQSYSFCSQSSMSSCRYIADGTSVPCNSCGDCAQAAQQIASWCSGGPIGPTGPTGPTRVVDMAMDTTLPLPHPDLASGPTGPTGPKPGDHCSTTADCKIGTSPQCYQGACISQCRAATDCASGTVCLFMPATSTDPAGVCAKPCTAPNDCVAGWGCWVALDQQACWATAGVQEYGQPLVLNCDPTAANCNFGSGNLPGGCERMILGAGDAGVCRRGCEIGEGTCPNAPDNSPMSCYLVDGTVDTNHMSTGDTLKQPICVGISPLIADGQSCLDPSGSGQYFFDICQAGSQCETADSVSGGDNKCHKLCYLSSFTPPDAGPLFADGGVSMGCAAGSCQDVFGTSSTPMPVGLCP